MKYKHKPVCGAAFLTPFLCRCILYNVFYYFKRFTHCITNIQYFVTMYNVYYNTYNTYNNYIRLILLYY